MQSPLSHVQHLVHTALEQSVTFVLLVIGVIATCCQGLSDPTFEGEPMGILRGSLTAPTDASDPKVAILWAANDQSSACTGVVRNCGLGVVASKEAFDDRECWQPCIDLWIDFMTQWGDGPEGQDRCPSEEELEEVASCAESCENVTYIHPTPWYGTCNHAVVGTAVDIESDLSGSFALKFYDAPANEALSRTPREPRVAIGIIALLDIPFDGPLASETGDWSNDFLGVVEDKAIIYAADPVPADSRWGSFLGGAFSVGYHVVDLTYKEVCHVDGPCDPELFCSPHPEDLRAHLTLQVGSSNLPSFFSARHTALHIE